MFLRGSSVTKIKMVGEYVIWNDYYFLFIIQFNYLFFLFLHITCSFSFIFFIIQSYYYL
jgi:hypothetical protein